MDLAVFQNPYFLFRWIHVLAGITWIGLLYYFNFVQGEYFKEADGGAKSDAIQKLVPRALWWFRWGAMLTFLTGLVMFMWLGHRMQGMPGLGITVGATLGTIMFLNVWLIIWPAQKIVIASATGVAGGQDPLPEAGPALARAGLASRTNTLFSFPMAFFMLANMHLPVTSESMLSRIAIFGLIALLALNGLKGKTGPMTSVKGVVHMGIALTVVLYLFIEFL
jgi:uncharacterized membrane protein